MAATKKRNAYRGLIAWMLVLLALCALCFAGYLYTRNYLSARAKQNEEDVLKINAGRTQEYNAAMAEHQQQSAADKDMPVSYTHLDVYKRQSSALAISPTLGSRFISATRRSRACRAL